MVVILEPGNEEVREKKRIEKGRRKIEVKDERLDSCPHYTKHETSLLLDEELFGFMKLKRARPSSGLCWK